VRKNRVKFPQGELETAPGNTEETRVRVATTRRPQGKSPTPKGGAPPRIFSQERGPHTCENFGEKKLKKGAPSVRPLRTRPLGSKDSPETPRGGKNEM